MRNIARLSDNDRRELFRNTADKMGLNDAIVEKDFWVCFTLDYLFHRSPWKESITFKGGTSLSKAFHLISRFSEDIDLILTGVYWDMAKMNHGRNVPIQNRMLLTKKPMCVQRYFCPKHSARQSKPAYPRKSVVKQMST